MIRSYIRPLRVEDANTSYKWRNDPIVWKYTGSRPDRKITKEIESTWIQNVLNDTTCFRFAICIEGSDEYIGNVQLTNVADDRGQFHIFIGNRDFWGKKVAQQATRQILDFAKIEIGLKEVYLVVSKKNAPAIKVYHKCGFSEQEVFDDEVKMVCQF